MGRDARGRGVESIQTSIPIIFSQRHTHFLCPSDKECYLILPREKRVSESYNMDLMYLSAHERHTHRLRYRAGLDYLCAALSVHMDMIRSFYSNLSSLYPTQRSRG